MRIFKKKISVPQVIITEEIAKNRQDMEIKPDPRRDFTQPAHQNTTPEEIRPFFGQVGGLFRRLFRRKKKKEAVRDPEGKVYDLESI